MHPYYPPGAASSQIYSCGLHMMIFCLSLSHTSIAYPPIYPPAPSQMDSCGFILLIFLLIIVTQYAASSYSSRSSGEPSESSEEPLVEELGDPDKSEALFSMYLDRSDEDDRKTTERWKGECDAILIFVSMYPCFRVPLSQHCCIDWSFFGRTCCSSFHLRPGPPAESTGHLGVLSRKYLSSPGQHHYRSSYPV